MAAALLFHACPSAVVPRKCAVKITRYETKEDDPERDHLAEQVTIEAALYPLINDTINAVEKIMSSVRIWTHDGLKKAKLSPLKQYGKLS